MREQRLWRRHQSLAYPTLRERDVLGALFSNRVDQLREWFARTYRGDAFTFGSGRAALRAVLRAGGIGSGDEVIVCGFTCLAVPEAVIYAGAKPVYADLQTGGWSSGATEVEAVASSRTRAVIVQHTFGIPAPVAAITSVARQRGWLVIEDCALAFGSAADSAPIGVHGDAAIFSFEMTKTITAGWGGLAVVRDGAMRSTMHDIYRAEPELAAWRVGREWAQVLMSVALLRPGVLEASRYVIAALYKSGVFRVSGRPLQENAPKHWSYRLPRPHASIVYSQLARLEHIKTHAAEIVSKYRHWLDSSGRPDVSGPRDPAIYLLRFPLLVADRDELVVYASRRGFDLGRWFDAPVSPMTDPPQKAHYAWGMCPRAEQMARHVINLPVNLRMTPADVDRLLRVLDTASVRCLPERR